MRNLDLVTSTPTPTSIPTSNLSPSSSSSPCSSPSPPFPFQSLDVYRSARELASLVHRVAIADAELRDQATRAAKSTFLNLCEGLPDDRAAMRRKYFDQADGSLHEVAGAVDLAAAVGALPQDRAEAILALAARVRAMIRGLRRATGRGR